MPVTVIMASSASTGSASRLDRLAPASEFSPQMSELSERSAFYTETVPAVVEALGGALHGLRDAGTFLPRGPGLYSWWAPPGLLPGIKGRPHSAEPDELFYVGIASPTSGLRKRIVGQHLGRRTGSSTLRRSLAALAGPAMGLTPVWRGDRVALSPADEAALTAFMITTLRLSVVTHHDPGGVESAVIAAVQPPLSLAANRDHPVWDVSDNCAPSLAAIRRAKARTGSSDMIERFPPAAPLAQCSTPSG